MKVPFDESKLKDLLQGNDPTVLALLYECYAEMLRDHFLIKFTVFQNDPADLENVITDSLIELANRPSNFDSSKSSLKTFIFKDVEGNLINELKKRNRIKNAIHHKTVELDDSLGNIEQEEYVELYDETMEIKLKEFISNLFPSKIDQTIVWMITVEKTRETSKFGTVLNIEHLDVKEQEEIVKNHKDRIKVKLKRNNISEFLKSLRGI